MYKSSWSSLPYILHIELSRKKLSYIMVLYLWLIEFRSVSAKRKKMIHEYTNLYSLDADELPWTSIYQQLTLHKILVGIIKNSFTLFGRTIPSQLVPWEGPLQTQVSFRLQNVQIMSFVWCKRVIRHLEPSNNIVISVDSYVSLHTLYNAWFFILTHFLDSQNTYWYTVKYMFPDNGVIRTAKLWKRKTN